MSRMYAMAVEIRGFRPEALEAIKAAVGEEWDFGEWYEIPDEKLVHSDGDGTLAGGESEAEFAERLAKAIWRANRAYCEVTVHATYMEDLPYETYSLTEEDYERLTTTAPAEETPDTRAHEDEAFPES